MNIIYMIITIEIYKKIVKIQFFYHTFRLEKINKIFETILKVGTKFKIKKKNKSRCKYIILITIYI